MKYAPLLLENFIKLKTKKEKLSFINIHKNNTEFIDLLYLSQFTYPKYDYKVYKNSGILQKNQHKKFYELAKYIKFKQNKDLIFTNMNEFLNSCDIHSQKIYLKILSNEIYVPHYLNEVIENLIVDINYTRFYSIPIKLQEGMLIEIHPKGQQILIVKNERETFIQTNKKTYYFNEKIKKVLDKIILSNILLFGIAYIPKLKKIDLIDNRLKISLYGKNINCKINQIDNTKETIRFFYQNENILKYVFQIPEHIYIRNEKNILQFQENYDIISNQILLKFDKKSCNYLQLQKLLI